MAVSSVKAVRPNRRVIVVLFIGVILISSVSILPALSIGTKLVATEDRIVTFSPTKNVWPMRKNDICSIDFAGIVATRNLRHPKAVEMLRTFLAHERNLPPYDEEKDLLVFEHGLKTGGTSFSNKLLEIFGKDGIVPGSRESGFFQKNELDQEIKELADAKDADAWWKKQKAMYSHTFFQQTKATSFEDWFLEHIPKDDNGELLKRVQLLTIYRDPIDWLASNFNEWMCRLRGRITAAYTGLYPDKELPEISPINDPHCWNMTNLTLLADYYVKYTLPRQCQEGNKDARRLCNKLNSTGTDPTPHCRSVQGLVESDLFNGHMRDNPSYLIQINGGNTTHPPTESLLALEERALQRFSGLVPHSRVPLRWISLTERYDESLVLFYDWLGLPIDESLGNDQKMRYKYCRPTSFWSQAEIDMLSRKVARSYVVHNVANAIIDIRMADWCCRRRLQFSASEDIVMQRFC